jgi:hypothetical protein
MFEVLLRQQIQGLMEPAAPESSLAVMGTEPVAPESSLAVRGKQQLDGRL